MKFAQTRIAPTPSGFLHLGNAYSFLLTKAFAEKHGAKILLRIDDLDRERYRQEYVQDILDTLDFLEIQIHQGPSSIAEFESQWTQQERRPLYQAALEQVQQSRLLFSCTCTKSQILQIDPRGIYLGQCLDRRMPLDKNEAAWRINTLDADFLDYIAYPDTQKSALIPEEASCYVVRKKDKNPAYQLSSLVDDIYFGVDLIVRGQDLFPSTLGQLDLARILGKEEFAKTTFYHHPLLKGPDQSKLSKSAGAFSIRQLRQEGKTLRDVLQLMGKSLGLHEEIQSFPEFSELALP
ncbi:MAG: glutamate--tRNA ligase family protein [Algoriphagus sp.]|nr:glutamate--tRNA ligase family protein [Algoriphagus sp.]